MKALLAAIVFLLAAMAAGHAADQPQTFPEIKEWSSLRIVYESRITYPDGEAYKVEIFPDGAVWYEGFAGVAAKGQIPLRISREAVTALFAKFRAANFFALNDAYRGGLHDVGQNEITLTIAFDGRSKSVTDYFGPLAGMPASVTEIERTIEQIKGLKALIKAYE